jgi:hypothetical protein
MAKTPISESKVLVADAEGAARVQANLDKFNRLLDQLDREMPRRKRPVIGIYLPVTEKFKDLLPATEKIADAVKFFEDVGLKPIRTHAEGSKYDVSFDAHYDFLSSQGRANFWPADVLSIRFTVPSLDSHADIEAFYVVLINDSSL